MDGCTQGNKTRMGNANQKQQNQWKGGIHIL